jgi:hypothetical protein
MAAEFWTHPLVADAQDMDDRVGRANPEPAHYEICVCGHLGQTLLANFSDLRAEVEGANTALNWGAARPGSTLRRARSD